VPQNYHFVSKLNQLVEFSLKFLSNINLFVSKEQNLITVKAKQVISYEITCL